MRNGQSVVGGLLFNNDLQSGESSIGDGIIPIYYILRSNLALDDQVKFFIHGSNTALDLGNLYFKAVYFKDYLIIFEVLFGDFSFKVAESPLGNSPSTAHGYQEGGKRN